VTEVKKFTFNSLVAFAVLIACCPSSWAQAAEGTITGIVSDSSGAVLPGASLVLKNVSTGAERNGTSDAHGEFTFTPVQVGPYELTVTAAGFQTQVRSGLVVQVQQTLNVLIPLTVGASAEKVVVTSSEPALQTEDSSVGQVVDSHLVSQLPLNGRNVYQLITLTPGVAIDPAGRASISGQTSINQYYALDGTDNNNYQGGLTSGQAYTVGPSPDAIQEFKVQTSNYSAEFGQSAGGVVNVITKSGTNNWHGSVYEFFRNNNLDGRNYFAQNRPRYQQNQFGASLGGPVIIPKLYNGRDKLFFFADDEQFLSNKGTTENVTLPSAPWRTGNLSSYLTGQTYVDPCTGATYDTGQLFDPTSTHVATCAGGGTGYVRTPISYNGQADVLNPALISPVAAATLALVPEPNSGTFNYISNPINKFNYNRGDLRIDYQWGEHDHMFARYSILAQPSTGVPNFPGPASGGTKQNQSQQGITVADTHIFSQTLINEVRFGWTRNFTNTNLASSVLNAQTLGYGGTPYQPGLLTGLPTISFSDVGGFGASGYQPALYDARDQHINDTLSMIRGKQSFKFGGNINHANWFQFQSPYGVGAYSFSGDLTQNLNAANLSNVSAGSGFMQFLYGIPNISSLSNSILSNNIRTSAALFVQDDWKVTPKLTVNLGLRWEFGTGFSEEHNRVSGLDLSTGSFEIPKSREKIPPYLPAGAPVEYVNSNTLMTPKQRNFGPRVGFAYQLNGKTVIRAAGGIFYNSPFISGTCGYPLNPPFAVTANVDAPATGPLDPVTGLPVVSVTNIASGFPSTFLTNYSLASVEMFLLVKSPTWATTNAFNAALQREFFGGTTLEASYVGSTSSHVNAGFDINQPYPTADSSIPVTSRRPLPTFGSLPWGGGIVGANYSSFQTKLQKQYSKGLTLLGVYTWGHSIDDAPSAVELGTGGASGDVYDFFRDARNLKADRGNSYFDIRHRVVFSYLYDLPFGKGHSIGSNWSGWLNQALGGWQIGGIAQFQTGFHFSAITYNDPSNSDIYTYTGAAYPDRIGNPKDFSYGQSQQAAQGCPVGHQSLQCFMNIAAFGYPAPGNFGNEGRNGIVGPDYFTWDFSTFKQFQINEGLHVEFRGEFFNFTNHPNFALPNNVVGNANFGQVTVTNSDPRDIQLALRLVF
jgi:hypothetical protein